VRGIALEYRNKMDHPGWHARWDVAIVVGSAVPALLWGVALANIVRGVPINADQDFTGSFFTLLNPYALLAGCTTLLLFALHGAIFLALKTHGEIRDRARRLVLPIGGGTVVLAAAFLLWTRRWTAPGSPGSSRSRPRSPSSAGWPPPASAGTAGRSLALPRRSPSPRDLVRHAVPERAAVDHRPRVQPHHGERGVHGVHAEDHDLGGGGVHADRGALPELHLLDLPSPTDQAGHHRHPVQVP
jgi:hypothetical protein